MDKAQQFINKAKDMAKQTAKVINQLLPDNELSESQKEYIKRQKEAEQKRKMNKLRENIRS